MRDELRAAGGSARAVALDVTDVEQVREVVAAADAETPLGTVVANAGIAFARPLAEVEPDGVRPADGRQRPRRLLRRPGGGARDGAARAGQRRHRLLDVGVHRLDRPDDRLRRVEGSGPDAHPGCRAGGRGERRARQRGRARNRRDRTSRSGSPRTAELAALGESRVPLGRLGRPEEIAAAVAFLSSRRGVVHHGPRARRRRRLARVSSACSAARSLDTAPSRFTIRTSQPLCERTPRTPLLVREPTTLRWRRTRSGPRAPSSSSCGGSRSRSARTRCCTAST